MKRFLPGWVKTPLRKLADSSRREGEFFELQGRHDIIHKALITLDFNGIEGVYAEFGCCSAYTFGCASDALKRCRHIRREMYAFDSFAGLPPADCPVDDHPRWIAGTMAMGVEDFHAACRRKRITNYHVVPGFYSDTLPRQPSDFLPAGQIAMAYVDCDLYASTVEVLAFLGLRLQHGMIIAFDDYWCYGRDDVSGERKAFLEWSARETKWRFEPYQPYGWSGMSFVVEHAAASGQA